MVWILLGSLVGASFGAAGFLGLHVLLEIQGRLRESDQRLAALINLRPLTGSLPVDLGGWAADPILMDTVLRIILRTGARTIVECGSGWSTVLMARCVQELDQGRVLALEHDRRFAERTRALLSRYGAADRARVVYAPLEPREIEGEPRSWYGPAADDAIDGEIDLLLVDGPPGHLYARSRFPAVPVFRSRLSAGYTVVLDDGLRPDERWTAHRWSELLGVRPKLIRNGNGIWLFEAGAARGHGATP